MTLQLYSDELEQEWLSHFLLAETYFSEKNYASAVEEYSIAISLSKESLFLYLQRGKTYELMKLNEQAWTDFDYVVNQSNAFSHELIQGLWGRARMYLCLNEYENCKKDFDKVKEIDPNFPQILSNNQTIVWRNVNPAFLCKQLKEKYINSLIEVGVCSSREDVKFSDNGLCIIKKRNAFDCQNHNDQKNNCENCEFSNKEILSFLIGKPSKETNCIYWCDRVFVTAQVICSRAVNVWCAALCVGVAETCKQQCYVCCQSGSFYEKCVKPFENFLERVGCEPGID